MLCESSLPSTSSSRAGGWCLTAAPLVSPCLFPMAEPCRPAAGWEARAAPPVPWRGQSESAPRRRADRPNRNCATSALPALESRLISLGSSVSRRGSGNFATSSRRNRPRVRSGLLHQRIQRGLMAILPCVQIAVHSLQEESHQQAPDGQADQKEDDRFCAEVFALKLRFLVVPVDVNVVSSSLATHASTRARLPELRPQTRRRPAPAASYSDCGRSTPATILPSRSGPRCPAR